MGGNEGRLRDGGVEEAVVSAAVGSEMEGDRASASRNTMNDDVSWVASETGDVLLDPMEEQALVEHAGVEGAVGGDFGAGKEAPEADAVIEVDEDEVPLSGEDKLGAIPIGVGVAGIAAALDEDEDRQLHVGSGVGRGPDVSEEAIFVGVAGGCL
jgi:hypothetical protein